jgi:hypothetical protein
VATGGDRASAAHLSPWSWTPASMLHGNSCKPCHIGPRANTVLCAAISELFACSLHALCMSADALCIFKDMWFCAFPDTRCHCFSSWAICPFARPRCVCGELLSPHIILNCLIVFETSRHDSTYWHADEPTPCSEVQGLGYVRRNL